VWPSEINPSVWSPFTSPVKGEEKHTDAAAEATTGNAYTTFSPLGALPHTSRLVPHRLTKSKRGKRPAQSRARGGHGQQRRLAVGAAAVAAGVDRRARGRLAYRGPPHTRNGRGRLARDAGENTVQSAGTPVHPAVDVSFARVDGGPGGARKCVTVLTRQVKRAGVGRRWGYLECVCVWLVGGNICRCDDNVWCNVWCSGGGYRDVFSMFVHV
jgi:hypothetical protein